MDKNTEEKFATEILSHMKQMIKFWFTAWLVTVLLWASTIGAFLWYISLPTEEIQIDNGSGVANYIGNDLEGDLNNGKNFSEQKGSQTE